MKSHRIKALVLRHLYPVIRDFDLLSDMVYWPVIDTILWGVTSQWLSESSGNMQIVLTILIALVLWNVIWRSQAEVSRNLMDEIWNKNLVNIFSTPLKLKEWVTAVLLLSVLKTAITLVLLVPVMYLMYTVNVFQLGWWLLVFFLGCLITGWWVGFISAGIVLRYGQKMQTVVWTLPGILLPFSAIYYPVDKLPAVVQPISLLIPTTYIFESMRSLLAGHGVDLQMMVICFGLNFLWLAVTLWYFVRSYHFSKNLGLGRL
jgi:ABC-2 type transport system permease protein